VTANAATMPLANLDTRSDERAFHIVRNTRGTMNTAWSLVRHASATSGREGSASGAGTENGAESSDDGTLKEEAKGCCRRDSAPRGKPPRAKLVQVLSTLRGEYKT